MGNPIGALDYAERAHELSPQDKGVMELMDNLNTPFNDEQTSKNYHNRELFLSVIVPATIHEKKAC